MLRCVLQTWITMAVMFGLQLDAVPATAQEAGGQPDEIEADFGYSDFRR